MNDLLMAWETTIEDVEMVLISIGGEQTRERAEKIFERLNCQEISKAALQSTEFSDQVNNAYKDIEKQIIAQS
jgi:hypothetical protein